MEYVDGINSQITDGLSADSNLIIDLLGQVKQHAHSTCSVSVLNLLQEELLLEKALVDLRNCGGSTH